MLGIVSVKTGKPECVAVHGNLLAMLQRLSEGSPIIAFGLHDRTLQDHFKALQRHAGLAENRIFSPQAFRRLHAQTMAMIGFEQAHSAASTSLDHSSSAVTAAHYSDPRSLLLGKMPSIFAANETALVLAGQVGPVLEGQKVAA